MSTETIRAHVREGELVAARDAAIEALAEAEEPERSQLYALLARVCTRLGEPREALRAAEQAQGDHWETALALGEALIAVGEPFRARAVLADALEQARRSAPSADPAATDAPEAAHAALRGAAGPEVWLGVALAEATRSGGDPQTGIAVASRAIAFAEQAFGDPSHELADALYALGVCEHGAGQEHRAFDTLKRALELRRALQPRHPDVAATLDAMGLVERGRNRPYQAVALHQEALALWIERLGERSGPVAASRHALAQALHRTGEFELARDEMTLAWLITGRTFGPEHVDTWIARFELGRFEVDCGQVEEGFHAMEEARVRVRELLGQDHPVVGAMDRWL